MRAYRKKWPMKTIEKMLKLTANEIAKLEFYMHILFLPIRLSKLNWNTHAVRKDVEKSTLSSITHRSAKQCNIYRGQFERIYQKYKHIYYLI